jgi:cob(I)alamin adenosyltransferase
MSISTRKGDSGQTDLLFGQRVPKKHPRVKALGAVDELTAALGLMRVHADHSATRDIAAWTQLKLISLMGELATPQGQEQRYATTHAGQQISTEDVQWLDAWVARIEQGVQLTFKGWVLPGAAGKLGAAHADMARAVARRAEIAIMDLESTHDQIPNAEVLRLLNRLSDVLWLLARCEEQVPSGSAALS